MKGYSDQADAVFSVVAGFICAYSLLQLFDVDQKDHPFFCASLIQLECVSFTCTSVTLHSVVWEQ